MGEHAGGKEYGSMTMSRVQTAGRSMLTMVAGKRIDETRASSPKSLLTRSTLGHEHKPSCKLRLIWEEALTYSALLGELVALNTS